MRHPARDQRLGGSRNRPNPDKRDLDVDPKGLQLPYRISVSRFGGPLIPTPRRHRITLLEQEPEVEHRVDVAILGRLLIPALGRRRIILPQQHPQVNIASLSPASAACCHQLRAAAGSSSSSNTPRLFIAWGLPALAAC